MRLDWYQPADLPDLLELHLSILDRLKQPAFFNWNAQSLAEELKISKTLVHRAQKQKAKAFIAFRELEDAFEIMVLGTHSDSTQKGLMVELLGTLQAYAAQQDRLIRLEVHEANIEAKRLYLKCAFKLAHKRKSYYSDGAAAELYVWKKSDSLK